MNIFSALGIKTIDKDGKFRPLVDVFAELSEKYKEYPEELRSELSFFDDDLEDVSDGFVERLLTDPEMDSYEESE